MQNSDTITLMTGDFAGYYVTHLSGMVNYNGANYQVHNSKKQLIGGYSSMSMPACCGALVISSGHARTREDYKALMAAIDTVAARQNFRNLFATTVEDTMFDYILKTKTKPSVAATNVRSGNTVNSFAWSP